MSHPRADLLLQMPHPGEEKVVKCFTNAREGGGGVRAVGIDGALRIELLSSGQGLESTKV